MSLTKEELILEVLENARKDRRTIERVRDQIINLANDPSLADGISIIGIAENVGYLGEVLTKMNSQIVELVKVAEKSETPEDGQQEKDSIFEEIESANKSN